MCLSHYYRVFVIYFIFIFYSHMTSKLKSTISFPNAVFYWLGTIIGAWIYVLVGKVALQSWMYAPISFLIASLLAIFSALSYAELSSRFPQAAWAALYVQRSFGKVWLCRLTWGLIFLSWLISAWVMANGFAAYFSEFFGQVPLWWSALWIVTLLTVIALLWINLSSIIITGTTIISLLGLFMVLWVARWWLADLPARFGELVPTALSGDIVWWILLWAFLAFYAYIWFEDLANVAEEVKNPRKTMPKTIITIMVISTILYVLVALVAVLGMPLSELTVSDRPLAVLYENVTGTSPWIISLIALFSVVNGILVQILMTSRLLYGMWSEWWLPKRLSYVHPRTNVPLVSTLLVFVVIALFTLFFPLEALASYTSLVILSAFSLVNIGLLIIKRKERKDPVAQADKSHYRVHWLIPFCGALINIFFVVYKIVSVL